MSRGGPEQIDLAETPYQIAQDEFFRFVLRECGFAVVRWLEENGRMSRPISAITREEGEGIAAEVIGKYAELREWKRQQLNLPLQNDPTKPDALELFGR